VSAFNLKYCLPAVVVAGFFAAAGPASAATNQSSPIVYNGHAGLGANAGITDGTSNTIMFGERATPPAR
jgi:hypothetical protein